MLKKFIVSLLIFFTPMAGVATMSYATDVVAPVTTDSNSLAQVQISPFFMTMLVSTVLPLLVGIFTRSTTRPIIKGIILLFLNAASSLLLGAAMVGSGYIVTKESAITALLAFVASVGTYTGLWKKAGVTSSAVAVPGPTPGTIALVPGKLAGVGVKDS